MNTSITKLNEIMLLGKERYPLPLINIAHGNSFSTDTNLTCVSCVVLFPLLNLMWQRTYIWEFLCTLEDGAECAPAPLSWLHFSECHEMRWYTVWDETPDRDSDRTEVTKDIPLCLTARQWHNVAWNTVRPTLFSGGSAHAAKSPYFHLKIMKPITPVTLWCFPSAECCYREIGKLYHGGGIKMMKFISKNPSKIFSWKGL